MVSRKHFLTSISEELLTPGGRDAVPAMTQYLIKRVSALDIHDPSRSQVIHMIRNRIETMYIAFRPNFQPLLHKRIPGSLKSSILRFALEQNDLDLFIKACTRHHADDCSPDATFFSWIRQQRELPEDARLPLLDFNKPQLQFWLVPASLVVFYMISSVNSDTISFRLLVTSGKGLAGRLKIVNSLPEDVLSGQGGNTIGDLLTSLLLPLDVDDPMLTSVEDGLALFDTIVTYGDDTHMKLR